MHARSSRPGLALLLVIAGCTGAGPTTGDPDLAVRDASALDAAGDQAASPDAAESDSAAPPDATQPDAASSADMTGWLPCGDQGLACDPGTQVCVRREAWVLTYSCETVPNECTGDRTCGCLKDRLCIDGFNVCNDAGDNLIACICPAC